MKINVSNRFSMTAMSIQLLALMSLSCSLWAAKIQPINIAAESPKGKAVGFEISVENESTKRQNYEISYGHYEQDEKGFTLMKDAEEAEMGPWSWVAGLTEKFSINSNESLKVSGIFAAPKSKLSKGSNSFIIFVTEVQPKPKNGVAIQFRYAVLMDMHIGKPKAAKFYVQESFYEHKKADGTTEINFVFHSDTPYKTSLDLQLTVKGLVNGRKRTIAQVSLMTPAAHEKGSSRSAVYPVAKHSGEEIRELSFKAILPPLAKGEYSFKFKSNMTMNGKEIKLKLKGKDGKKALLKAMIIE
jgi:hypothetical protein